MRTPGSIARTIGPQVHRLQPKSLSGRLAVAAMILSLLAAGTTFALSYAAAMRQIDQLSQSQAGARLHAMQAFLDLEAREVDLRARELAGEPAVLSAAEGGKPIPAAVARSLASAADVESILCADATGTLLLSRGEAGDNASLDSLASRASTAQFAGLTWLPSGAAVVARHAIRDDAGARTLGWVTVARALDPDLRARFLPLSDDTLITLRRPRAAPRPAGHTIAGFSNVAVGLGEDGSTVTAQLPGIDGPAAEAELRILDSGLRSAMATASRVALVSGALVGLLGAAFGLALAQAFAGPIGRMRHHVKSEGARALEGESIVPLMHRPETSSDFLELTADLDDLLVALGERQSAIKAATEQAQAAETSLRSVLEDSPEAKLLVEREHVALVNSAAERILGVPASALLGKHALEVLDATAAFTEDGRHVTREMLLAAGRHPLVARIERADGEVWLEVKVIQHAGDAERFLLSARDITEERRIEQLREELFSLVSHDLRAPLTVVQGYLDILARPLTPQARTRALESARHNAAKMADLLEDLLDVAGAEQVLAPKALEPVHLGDLAEEVAESLQSTAPDRRLEVVHESRAVALGEERRLRQALVNLVTNALKYTPTGSRVVIRVQGGVERGILAVEDDGPGVPPESRDAIFERFGRAASAEGKPGLGLGLYIVRLIAENHGGGAHVEEAPSGGARFVLELPLAEAIAEDAETA